MLSALSNYIPREPALLLSRGFSTIVLTTEGRKSLIDFALLNGRTEDRR